MLILTSVVSWAGWPERVGEAILNTHRMSSLKTVNTNNCQCLYSERGNHQRGDVRLVEIDNTVAEVVLAADTAPAFTFFEVPVCLNGLITDTPESVQFKITDFVRAITHPDDATFSIMWVLENGVKLKRYVLDYSLRDLYFEFITGTTSNI